MIAIGFGCRRGACAADIVALVRQALADGCDGMSILGLFTLADKRGDPGPIEAAQALGLPLIFFEKDALRDVADRAQSRSERVFALHGLPCVAETAALAGAGPGAVLLVPRRASRSVTCAIAGPQP